MGNRVKNALTRKIGPLPAWGWFLLVGGAYYFYRKYSSASTGTGTGSVAPVAPVPGTGEQVLQPGESIYDPTAGTLATAPGGSTGSSSDTGALSDAMNALATAIGNGMPPQQVEISGGGTSNGGGGSGTGTTAGKRAWNKWFNRRFNKQFNKRWIARHRGQPGATRRTSKPDKIQSKSTARSSAKTRTITGGRTTARQVARSTTRQRHTVSPVRSIGTRLRQRALKPVVTHTVTQRRVATHPKPAVREAPTVQPRPSAPPKRTVRARAKPRPKRHR